MTQENTPFPEPNARIYLGSIIFFLYILISFPIIGAIILVCIFAPFSIRYALAKFWVGTILWAAEVLCGITHEIEGLENLPTDSPAIVLSKHQSAWETLALRQLLPTQVVLLKESLLWIPFGGWALATLRPIPINRDKTRESLKKLIEQGTQALKDNLWVVVFPEGTRTALGENKKFNAGGAMLAHKSGYPVIPLAHNAGTVWPRYSFLKYPGVIKVKIGAAIEVEGKKAKEINAEAEDWIAKAMAEMGQ
ncbi:MAG: 1-acyl-sn-glycerol-3-phosphate acyltransferase [Methylococcaceae bacterium]|nr:1-acyl-sn-glycerol-3-phosphate acyltransferase [Methylococcaceae bacterium]